MFDFLTNVELLIFFSSEKIPCILNGEGLDLATFD